MARFLELNKIGALYFYDHRDASTNSRVFFFGLVCTLSRLPLISFLKSNHIQ